ncbi:MAG TPA: response regulator transcription factor [Vicinamibacterales bacterium]|nr:response regulator transcription factor [Vicinamibacterales bacterium]
MIQVMLVEDHGIVREGLRQLLDAQEDMRVVGEAVDGEEALANAPALRPDIIVLDLSLPGKSGIEVAAELRASCPGAALVVLTRHREPSFVRQLFAAGALAYVLKQSASRELLAAVRAAAIGRRYIDMALHDEHATPVSRASLAVTEREAAVLRLTAAGHTHKEIGAMLGIAEKTVEAHKANAMRKLNLRSRADLIRHAALQGWLQAS